MMSRLGKLAIFGGFLGLTYMLPEPLPMTSDINLPMSWAHLLGTSSAGYDIVYLVLFATIRSAWDAVLATLFTFILAAAIGLWAGNAEHSWFDQLQAGLGKLVDSLGAFIICACWVALFPKTPAVGLYMVLALVSWPGLTAIIRADIIRARGLLYVEAAYALGLTPIRVFFVHILPEVWSGLRSILFGLFSGFIGIQGALGFIGLGSMNHTNLGYLLFDFQSSFASPGFWACVVAFMTLLIFGHAVSRRDRQARERGLI